jgi:tetratricopeptide (TPR) repeat protein
MGVNIEELDRRLDQVLGARPRDVPATVEVLEQAVQACQVEPDAAGELFDLVNLLDELAEAYDQQGRTDDALAVMREAIQAGYRGQPDPRCRLAEINLRGGRTEPAAALFAEVKTDTPTDVWLYNNAGLEYAAVGDHPEALRWLSEGLALALDTGDPERLVSQLIELRAASLDVLGRDHDQLQTRAQAFLERPQPPIAHRHGLLDPSTAIGPCALKPTSHSRQSSSRAAMGLGLAWFPLGEFTSALRAWPQLAQSWGTTDHATYNRQLQRHLVKLTDMTPATSTAAWIVPVHLTAFHSWCEDSGHDPSTPEARSAYAAELVRLQAPGLICWPPQRNTSCWCSSGRKYKKCCGHPSVLAHEPEGR